MTTPNYWSAVDAEVNQNGLWVRAPGKGLVINWTLYQSTGGISGYTVVEGCNDVDQTQGIVLCTLPNGVLHQKLTVGTAALVAGGTSVGGTSTTDQNAVQLVAGEGSFGINVAALFTSMRLRWVTAAPASGGFISGDYQIVRL